MGFILPIFKGKGSHTEPNNYRPITILSCLGKLFTSVLNERLVQFNSIQNIINENQAGFRKSYSTLDHVTLSFLQNLLKSQKKKLFVGYIDFSRCFDTIPRAEPFQNSSSLA